MNPTMIVLALLSANDFDAVVDEELRLLRVQRESIARHLEQEEKRFAREKQDLLDEISSLSDTLTRLTLEHNASTQGMLEREQRMATQEREALLRAELGLGELPLAEAEPEVILGPVERSLDQLRDTSAIKIEQGSYFDRSGALRTGDILSVGAVAAIALSPRGGGALVPSGEEAEPWHVVRRDGLDDAINYVAGRNTFVELLLVDAQDPQSWDKRSLGLWERFVAGGWVMWPLALLGLIALLVALWRAAVLFRYRRAWTLIEEAREHVASGSIAQARVRVRGSREPAARALDRILDTEQPQSPQQHEAGVVDALVYARTRLEGYLTVLSSIGATAPLLGLLGTVSGMITAFVALAAGGAGDPQALSGGISEALLTTQWGLAVAIPATLAHAWLRRWAHRIFSRLEREAAGLFAQVNAISKTPNKPSEANV